MKKHGSKSLKGFIVSRTVTLVACAFAAIFWITFMMVKDAIVNVKTQDLTLIVDDASERMTAQINSMYAMAQSIAADEDIYNPDITFEDKKDKLAEYAKTLNISSIGYITAQGQLTSTDGFKNDISSRQYFKDMMNGKNYISNPSFNTATQK